MSLVFSRTFQKRRTLGALFSPFWVRLFLAFVDGKVRIFGGWVRYLAILRKVILFTLPLFSRKEVCKKGAKGAPRYKKAHPVFFLYRGDGKGKNAGF